MEKIQEINWDHFRTKFSGKEQISFEWLCYLLFCVEYKQSTGIPRYFNQAGIETNPIYQDNKWIGWQAKFYKTRLSEHKSELINTIKITKQKYPEVDTLIFYLNQDFSQGKNESEPKYKKDIEKFANTNNIDICWKAASFFESPFVCIKNSSISHYFFSLMKSELDLASELLQHSESVLTPIQSKIVFNQDEIKIDRKPVLEKLKETLLTTPAVIVSGEAGVGKTALLKDFYQAESKKMPMFVFKAIEFNTTNVNQVFKNYGEFTFLDFLKPYETTDEKLIVIDSAEKLSDLEHQEVFLELLSTLLQYNWKVIFTTRHSYLDDLKYQFIEIFKISFKLFNIDNLSSTELKEYSNRYKFTLPDNDKLLSLLRNPFYLNEYLQNYQELDSTLTYLRFKEVLWNKIICKSSFKKNNSHIKRENCFIEIAFNRANTGSFFVQVENCEDAILQLLDNDEIIKYDSNHRGYFITHDIYEEWALEKVIESTFNKSENDYNFFATIGNSLPVRRSFRNWLSDKLLIKDENVIRLIEGTMSDDKVDNHWIDEILVSVLLSDYSETFFKFFETQIWADNNKLLLKIIFLLRIACKELDENLLMSLEKTKIESIPLSTIYRKPKGNGWNCTITFIYENKTKLGLNHLNMILSLIEDWNYQFKQGETTRKASQIALLYFNELTQGDVYYGSRNNTLDRTIKTILNGSYEIKNELIRIIEEIILNDNTDRRSRYHKLAETILSSAIDSYEFCKNLPLEVIKLAKHFWFEIPKEEHYPYRAKMGLESDFCIPEHFLEYFPASAYQTPVYQLLKYAPAHTINFILDFCNKTVECFAKSEYKHEIEEVEVHIDQTKTIKQYIGTRLWNMYRGTQVSTYLLESIHMALEKWFLEISEHMEGEILENWCKYLLENSKTASIASVVASIVMSQPSKLFNIAEILFRTKEYFTYDTQRYVLEQSHKSSLEMLQNNFGANFKNKLFDDERIKACDYKHRSQTLENIAVFYQFFKSEGETDEIVEERQKIIWSIFDEYYNQLPAKSEESENDKTWRLYLARMDRRKMHPTTEKKGRDILINFNPEIEPQLKKYSEDSIKKSNEINKYIALRLWSDYKFKREEDKCKDYPQYEENIQLVISETKNIINSTKNNTDYGFRLMNKSIPSYTCSILLKDYYDKLSKSDIDFCRDVIIMFASAPLLSEDYHFQVTDGLEPAVSALPCLIEKLPENKSEIKRLLLMLLIYPSRQISIFAIRAVLHSLRDKNFDDANSLLLGYLFLKSKYDEFAELIRKENYSKNIFQYSISEPFQKFQKNYVNEINRVILNNIRYDELYDVANFNIDILVTAFELMPPGTISSDHKAYLNLILPLVSKKIFSKDDKIDYNLKHRFFDKYAYYVLSANTADIEWLLKPFIDNFPISRDSDKLFSSFVSIEDKLNVYDNFWKIWNLFYPQIVKICNDDNDYCHDYVRDIVSNYLLAWQYWKEDAKEWHSLKAREKYFFKKVADELGWHTTVLYSLSKLFNEIGSDFVNDGVFWISDIISKYSDITNKELEINTIYYLENIVKKYILMNRNYVKTNKQIKNNILTILNFLVIKGSVTGYVLREDIL